MKQKATQAGFIQHHLWRTKNGAGFTLIEILIVIGVIALLAGIVLVAINPARQFAQARNTQRTAHVNAVLNAIGQYSVDNLGDIPAGITESEKDVFEVCADLVPTYMPALPVDPSTGEAVIEDCSLGTDTGYTVKRESGSGRIRVSAPLAGEETSLGEDAKVISALR